MGLRHGLGRAAAAAIAVLATTCSSPTKPGPVVVELAIHSVAPIAGPAAGGTEVTIRGAAFAAGAAVIDWRQRRNRCECARQRYGDGKDARQCRRRPSGRRRHAERPHSGPCWRIQVRAGSPEHRAGHQIDGCAGEAPEATAVVCGLRRNHSSHGCRRGCGDGAGAACLSMAAACGGAFTGTGPQVEWTAPAIGTLPSTCTVEVTVTDGPHVVVRSIVVRLHDSRRGSAEIWPCCS